MSRNFPLSNMKFWAFHHDQLTELGEKYMLLLLLQLFQLLLSIPCNFLDSLLFWCVKCEREKRTICRTLAMILCRMKYCRLIHPFFTVSIRQPCVFPWAGSNCTKNHFKISSVMLEESWSKTNCTIDVSFLWYWCCEMKIYCGNPLWN